jgi:hypothetical protein
MSAVRAEADIGAQNIFHLTVPYVFQVSSLESYIAAFQSMRVA